jgi:hypothetical protein
VREFERALPELDDEPKALFARMRDSHLRSIAALEALGRS